jgi:hypothetical protein
MHNLGTALLIWAMKFGVSATLSAPPPLHFIAKISNAPVDYKYCHTGQAIAETRIFPSTFV